MNLYKGDVLSILPKVNNQQTYRLRKKNNKKKQQKISDR